MNSARIIPTMELQEVSVENVQGVTALNKAFLMT